MSREVTGGRKHDEASVAQPRGHTPTSAAVPCLDEDNRIDDGREGSRGDIRNYDYGDPTPTPEHTPRCNKRPDTLTLKKTSLLPSVTLMLMLATKNIPIRPNGES